MPGEVDEEDVEAGTDQGPREPRRAPRVTPPSVDDHDGSPGTVRAEEPSLHGVPRAVDRDVFGSVGEIRGQRARRAPWRP
jgi:hypothetical protein